MSTQHCPHFQHIQPSFSDSHSSNKLDYICDTCQGPTSRRFTVAEQVLTDHRMISLESAWEKYMLEMRAHSEKVAQKVSNLKLRKNRMNDVRKDLDTNRFIADSKIKILCQNLINAIENQEVKLHCEVDDIYNQKCKQIDAMEERLENEIATAESIHSHLNHLLTVGDRGSMNIIMAQTQTKDEQENYDDLTNVLCGDVDSGLDFTENPVCLKINLGVVKGKNKQEEQLKLLNSDKVAAQAFEEKEKSDTEKLRKVGEDYDDTEDTSRGRDMDSKKDASTSGISVAVMKRWWRAFKKISLSIMYPNLMVCKKGTKQGSVENGLVRMTDINTNYYHSKLDSPVDINLSFYTNKIKSVPQGDYIDNIHKHWWGDYDKLERHHGYIQWIFPISEKGMNYDAQELQHDEAEKIKSDKKAWARVLISYKMMLDFYGMKLADKEKGSIQRAANWIERYSHLNRSTHNYLRITRMLKSLGELGYEHLKTPFVEFVLTEALENGELRNCLNSCVQYWVDTIECSKDRKRLTSYFDSHYEFF